ncbi:hypothetical protein ACTFIZ_008366 [Dictyostelium cf. discoideum]
MGKGDALTPKQIANKIKAKGLQRLRWYCQLCEKQCRDENGFKCHISSESHMKQMEVFSNKSSFIVSQYSKEFEEDFLRILSRQFINSRVLANQVYAEYIKDRHHIHMNATEWTSLTEFVKYLGKTSKCVVEETSKGWYIRYINRDPEYVMRKESEEKKEKAELNEEERQRLQIEKQIKELNKNKIEQDEIKPTELSKEDIEKMSLLELNIKPTTNTTTTNTTTTNKNIFDKLKINDNGNNNNNNNSSSNNNYNDQTNPKPYAKKMSAIEEIMFKEKEKERQQKEKLEFEKQQQQQQQQQQLNSNSNNNNEEKPWIIKDIVVKIIDKELANGKYYKQKGYIVSVENEFLAKVKLLDSGDILKIDQTFLETVIPQIGSTVIIVNGKYRGKDATIKDVNFDDFNAKLYLKDNDITITLPYESFKLIMDNIKLSFSSVTGLIREGELHYIY